MNIDSTKALAEALQNLNALSVPRIGTFTRKSVPAEIDHVKGVINPPRVEISLNPDQSLVSETVSFFETKYGLVQKDARALLEEISRSIFISMEVSDRFEIQSVGAIKKEKGGELAFEVNPSGFGSFFGLETIPYTIGKMNPAIAPVVEPKAEVKPQEKKAIAPVAPPPATNVPPVVEKKESPVTPVTEIVEKPKVVEPPAKKTPVPVQKAVAPPAKKKRSILAPAIVTILILAIAGGGFVFKDEIRKFLAEKGFFFTEEKKKDTVTDTSPPPDTVRDSIPEVVTDDKPVRRGSSYSGYGERAKKNMYYLIIASYGDPGLAEEEIGQYGSAAKVVVPPGGGRWRVSVYESADKNAAIAEMVKTKGSFSRGSWIYAIE